MGEQAGVEQLERTYERVRGALLAERESGGYWVGELCSSALSTATAVSALCAVDRKGFGGLINGGVRWLVRTQNEDGGWGDSSNSPSNVPTTMLVRAAFRLAGSDEAECACVERSEGYLGRQAGVSSSERVRKLAELYGKDRTFAVPILTNCALAGMVGWSDVPMLPFELGCVPGGLLKRLRLHVVSYALPALIAIGQLLHLRRPTRNPLLRGLRGALVGPTLRKLEALQPASGGFIEAIPLTSFVVMSLAGAGRGEHPVAKRGVRFIVEGVREDGSWPIDSNLSTWVTTQAVEALSVGDGIEAADARALADWLLSQQQKEVHPFTGSAPGGWSWTPLSGGVPDADDTSGALVALRALGVEVPGASIAEGLRWLGGLQNSDGGWPAFCRGWQRLPFDRSSPDLTAHALRAFCAWPNVVGAGVHREIVRKGFAYLRRTQRADGSWVPLWFGSQHTAGQVNPVYGTSRVLRAYADAGSVVAVEVARGVAYLLSVQNGDGGWGGGTGAPSSVEETALAVCALAQCGMSASSSEGVLAGVRYLDEHMGRGVLAEGAPIGLYFANLWYWERLYPLIWSVGALGAALRMIGVRGSEASGGHEPMEGRQAL